MPTSPPTAVPVVPPIADEISQDEIPTIAVDGPSPEALAAEVSASKASAAEVSASKASALKATMLGVSPPKSPLVSPPKPPLVSPPKSPVVSPPKAPRAETEDETVSFDPDETVAQTKPKKNTEAPVERTKSKASVPPPTPGAGRAKKPEAPLNAEKPPAIAEASAAPKPAAKPPIPSAPEPAAKPVPASVEAKANIAAVETVAPISADTKEDLGFADAEEDLGFADADDRTDANILTPIPEPSDEDMLDSALTSQKLPPLPKAQDAANDVDSVDDEAPTISPFDASESVSDVLTKTAMGEAVVRPKKKAAAAAPPAAAPLPAAPPAPPAAAPLPAAPPAAPLPDVFTRTVADAQALGAPPPSVVVAPDAALPSVNPVANPVANPSAAALANATTMTGLAPASGPAPAGPPAHQPDLAPLPGVAAALPPPPSAPAAPLFAAPSASSAPASVGSPPATPPSFAAPAPAPAPPAAALAAAAMPSAMIPRPPAASVVHTPLPVPVSSILPADASMAAMPGDYALPQVASSPAANAQPPGHSQPVHSPAPPAYAQGGQAQGGYAQGQPQGGYAQGQPPAYGALGQNDQPPQVVHTPPPPMNIGPPPDANDHSYPGAALDALINEEPMPASPQAAPQAGDSSNAVWRQAHPSAQRWAEKRSSVPPRTPRPGVIALGLVLAGLGAYLLVLFLPSKAPLTAAEAAEIAQQAGVDAGAWRFSEQLLTAATLNAALFVLLGVVVVLRGAMHRQAPGQARRKKIDKTSLMLLFCFALFAVSFLALVLSASVS